MEQIVTQLLKDHKSTDGVSLQNHLQQVILKYLQDAKNKGNVENFEVLSNFIKQNQFIYREPKSDVEVNNIPVQHNEQHEWVQQCQQLFRENALSLRRVKNLEKIQFPDFQQDAQILNWAGIGFGEEESYRIQMSLRKLQQQTQATQLRFWGKILTSGKDYYVAEGITSNQYADPVPKGAESKGEGANYYTYWVSHNVLEEWFELPLVSPTQIRQTRQIKYIFTGDLNKQINSYPPFNGKEKHFLRAQLARISHATVLTPKDLYAFNEDEKKLEYGNPEEAFKLQEYAELKTADNWVHLYPHLLELGRCTIWIDESLPEEQKDALREKLEADDPEKPRLEGIVEEKSPYPVKEEEEQENPLMNWKVKEYGDTQQFNTLKQDGTVCYGVIALKNMTWPGAALVCNNNRWCNIYVGYGLKVNQSAFQPLQPPEVQIEGKDVEEHREPNPDKPVETIEKDSDDEGKENEDEEQ